MALARFKQWARHVRRDVHAICLASHDPRVPWYAKITAIAVVAYALSPIDLIPDFVPVLGYLDDLVIVPIGIWLVVRMIPGDILAEYRVAATGADMQPRNMVAAAIIVAIWIAAAVGAGWLGFRYFL